MPEKIQTWINEFCSALPCLITYTKGKGIKIDWGKILQSLIIVAVIASSTSYVTVKVLETEFANLKEDMIETKSEFKELDKDNNQFKEDVAREISDIKKEWEKWRDRH
jgi:hypothetical protein